MIQTGVRRKLMWRQPPRLSRKGEAERLVPAAAIGRCATGSDSRNEPLGFASRDSREPALSLSKGGRRYMSPGAAPTTSVYNL